MVWMRLGCGITVIMVMLELLDQGLSTMCKAAMLSGMSNFVFVVYSNALSFFFLVPASFFFHRNNPPPKLTLSILFRIVLLSSLACCFQLLMWVGIGYSSPMLASVMTDLTPAFTFILAIISRMEKLKLRGHSSIAKLIGTIVSITGALVVTLYKGLPLINNTANSSSINNAHDDHLQILQSDWIFGGFLLACAAFVLSLLFIVLTWIVKDYPAEMMMASIGGVVVVVESSVVALIVERGRPEAWNLKPGIELIAIIYSAFFSVAVRNIATAWACRVKGPLYVSMFKPLGMVFATVLGVFFLGDNLYLGSVAGATVIMIGFYAVLWGKSQEEEIKSPDSREREPLLKKENQSKEECC